MRHKKSVPQMTMLHIHSMLADKRPGNSPKSAPMSKTPRCSAALTRMSMVQAFTTRTTRMMTIDADKLAPAAAHGKHRMPAPRPPVMMLTTLPMKVFEPSLANPISEASRLTWLAGREARDKKEPSVKEVFEDRPVCRRALRSGVVRRWRASLPAAMPVTGSVGGGRRLPFFVPAAEVLPFEFCTISCSETCARPEPALRGSPCVGGGTAMPNFACQTP
mmetsp:Transcript_16970/g.48215  ORF Transcript_16970/g.48215 Transcript_16970/m.48215 type:complete len:219 (-) Transcript_16970:452-1108(-)